MSDAKDQLENAAAQVLQSTINAATQGAEFIKDQIPDLLKQLLMWNAASDVLFVVMTIGIVFLAFKFFPKFSKWADDGGGDIFYWAFAGPACAVFSGFAMEKIWDAAEILIAPKVWLLEYAAHLVKH